MKKMISTFIVGFLIIGGFATVPIFGKNQSLLEFDISEEQDYSLENPYKILFIGSSYFNYNDLPSLFEGLAQSSGKEVFIDSVGRSGMYLSDHASNSGTASKINEMNWDYIILQGVGRLMAYPDYFTDHPVYPSLDTLHNKITENCETTKMIFSMPWAFEDGMTWYQNWTDTYEYMQIKIFENMLEYSEIDFIIAPVGWTWYRILEENDYPLHYLYMSDWNHPSLKGSFLMACVFYSTVFLVSSSSISFYGGLVEEEANYFQNIASNTVFNNLTLWNIEDENSPPEKPVKPSGSTQGKPETTYTYSSSTTDIDGDTIFYLFDWVDSTDTSWIDPYISGEIIQKNHSWKNKGSYEIRVKAEEEHGVQSDWSDTLEIKMSKNKILSDISLFLRGIDKFFLFHDVLNSYLMGVIK